MTDDRCPHHAECRSDHGLPSDQLCGYHHPRTWGGCSHFMAYKYQAGLEKAKAKLAKEKTAKCAS